MKKLFILLLIIASITVNGQRDTTLTIRVSSIREFPQIGLDLKGRKYFVMSTKQDKAALIALQQGVYADSILTQYEKLEQTCDSTISLLRGRVIDRGKTIDAQIITIQQLEFQLKDMRLQRDNNQLSIDDLTKQLKAQRVPMWAGGALAVLAGLALLNIATQ